MQDAVALKVQWEVEMKIIGKENISHLLTLLHCFKDNTAMMYKVFWVNTNEYICVHLILSIFFQFFYLNVEKRMI